MFNTKQLKVSRLLVPIVLLSMVACNDSDDDMMSEMIDPPDPMEYQYAVTVTNLTNAQPLSPIAAIAHSEGMLWQIGEPASAALELMAEGGGNSELLATDFAMASSSAESPLPPGEQVTLMLSTEQLDSLKISLATMLVNTNDAFTGLSQHDLSRYELGDVRTVNLSVYDSGTEANNESLASIPGPAAMGEGFNAVRDDLNLVTMHSGVVSNDDGLTNSALDQSHKFESIVAQVTIERIK